MKRQEERGQPVSQENKMNYKLIKNQKIMKLCTWNVCLGVRCKLSIIKELLIENDIDVLCVQEAEIKQDETLDAYQIQDYSLETEIVSSNYKIRTLMYIKCTIPYRRLCNLENSDTHIIIIKLIAQSVTVISMYRTYQLTVYQDHKAAFEAQMDVMARVFRQEEKVIALGDFNLDENKKNDPSYHNTALYNRWKEFEIEHQLIQLVNFVTWMRPERGEIKSSTIDHVYVNDQGIVESVKELSAIISDHSPILAVLTARAEIIPNKVLTRNWRNYTKLNLLSSLNEESWNIDCLMVEDYFDVMEQKIMRAYDRIVPLEEKTIRTSYYESPAIVELKRKRKNLFVNAKRRGSPNLLRRCRILAGEIRKMKIDSKRRNVRNLILNGGPQGMWKGYRLAQDRPRSVFPQVMSHDGNDYTDDAGKAQAFATFFREKINTIVTQTRMDPEVFNGEVLRRAENKNFFTIDNIEQAMSGLKDKTCFGFDNIPVRILKDGMEVLSRPFCNLFNLIYDQKITPEKWRTARVIPLHKKGNKADISNYRPIANLCASSKIFERLILTRLLEVEKERGVDMSGRTQHGFKKSKSTVTASLELQNQIAKALDDDCYVAVASLDLSAAFDVLNVNLLLTRMEKLGIPFDLLHLIKAWLTDRIAYVEVGGSCSEYYKIEHGSGQGSILGPVLFNYYMSPLIRSENMLAYADDSYIVKVGKTKTEALDGLQLRVIAAEQWMSGSGLKVNVSKTEMVVFHRHETGQGEIKIGEVTVKSKQSMNVLGIQFDNRLTWETHVEMAIKKSRSSLHAMRSLRKYFTNEEMVKLITANVYSVLYYGSQVWLLPNLKEKLYQKLFSTSGQILKIVDKNESFLALHKKFCRSTPKIFALYQTAVNLYQMVNDENVEFTNSLQTVQLTDRRNIRMSFVRNNKFKVGLNLLCNRLRSITNVIDKEWLNMNKKSFKLRCKMRIIQNSLESM